MITQIGIAAGDIWQYLDQKGNATLDQLICAHDRPKLSRTIIRSPNTIVKFLIENIMNQCTFSGA